MNYVELHCRSAYSFREGASTPRELVARAAELGYEALALTDRDGLYGAMEFVREAEAAGIRPIIGADVTLQGGHRLALLAETREGYMNLCRLLSHAWLAEARKGPRIKSRGSGTRGQGRGDASPQSLTPSPAVGMRPELPDPQIPLAVLMEHTCGLIALSGGEHGEIPALVVAGRIERAIAVARRYAAWFGPEHFFIELNQTLTRGDTRRNRGLVEVAQRAGVGVVATNDVWYHQRERHRLHDVLVAIRHRTTLDRSHRLRHANGERHLKSVQEMTELFAGLTGGQAAIRNTVAIARRCQFDLIRDLGYRFPHAPVPPGETPDSYLERICREAFERKYPSPGPRTGALAQLEEELRLIRKHDLAGFFLAYYDLLKLAGVVAAELKGRDPRLPPDERPVGRGRGSSVSSIVCYLIGLSHIDPIANELFLGRFLNDELSGVPDIDLDFPRDIREGLLKRIWTAFDEGRAALVCAFSTYHGRSAVRDVGKALGLPALELDHLAKLADSWSTEGVAKEMARLPEYREKIDAPLWRDLVDVSQRLMGLPRHVTQHVGGVVLSADPLQGLVPLEPTRMEGRVMCQWDKDSVEDARMVKIDFLALGMLSLVDECLDLIKERSGARPDLGRIPHDDSTVYDRICAADTIGLFQIESRAQIATLPHTQPRDLDDLAVQVAIVRPGPIVGGAFRPYMDYRRRQREGELVDVEYIHPVLEPVLKDTLGVVLYQEQVVQVAMAVAGYSPGEADRLRRNLNRRRGAELAGEDWSAFLWGAQKRGIPEDAARAAFQSILGFAAYGFPKSHAVAFALLAYESAWLRFAYPAEYYVALLNNQPMGFYAPEVIAGDARRHGIEITRPDINLSGVKSAVEADQRIRLGLAAVRGVGEPQAAAVVAEREAHGPFRSLVEFARRTDLRPEAIESIVLAGGFDGVSVGADVSPGLPRRDLLWQLGLIRGQGAGGTMLRQLVLPEEGREPRGASRRYTQRQLPLPTEQDMVALPPASAWEEVVTEYEVLGLSPARHVMALLRGALGPAVLTSADVAAVPDGTGVQVAGLVVCRQRPSTAKGVLFLSLEDEYGIVNAVVYPSLFNRQRTLILTEPFLIVHGRIQRQGGVTHVVARRLERPDIQTEHLIAVSHDFH